MNSFLHFNGDIQPADAPVISASSRGLRYGDGLFETIKVLNGAMPLFPLHIERMMQGLSILQMELPTHYTPDYLRESILDLCRRNNTEKAARVRITIIRGNGSLYTVDNPYASVLIQADPLADTYLTWNETGFKIDVYTQVQKSCDMLANVKSNNYLPYVMASLYAQKEHLNDCLLLNIHDRICDATIANMFWVRNRIIYTPPLSEGGVAGVMRRYLLTRLPAEGFTIEEKICTPFDLEEADEIFLTNGLYGIRWVQEFRSRVYTNQLSAELYNLLAVT
jgi:branched-chain amino acid aminotransferase